ncbi:hypothetical protein FOL47_008670 [Perkinsus chesapeaki]|uniref:Uncharacterized protein n=1 Tax=Perkinsus chesapeaki TaxID=330153 RepID=A0A7J6LCN1_PERCH|nr:hypothetical protein FOL47_008670 [Perkinsus chesapeaki]
MSGLITVRIIEAARYTLQRILASPNLALIIWTTLFAGVFLLFWRIGRNQNPSNDSRNTAVATPSSTAHGKHQKEIRRLVVSVSLDGVARTDAVYSSLQKLADSCDLVIEMVASSDAQEDSYRTEISEKCGIAEHRVLCSSTSSGRSSMVRQLSPAWHFDTNEDVLKYLTGLVPHLASVSASGSDAVRVFPSIDSFVNAILNDESL